MPSVVLTDEELVRLTVLIARETSSLNTIADGWIANASQERVTRTRADRKLWAGIGVKLTNARHGLHPEPTPATCSHRSEHGRTPSGCPWCGYDPLTPDTQTGTVAGTSHNEGARR